MMAPLLLLSLMGVQGAPPPAQKVFINGTVVDAQGNPVVEAEVGPGVAFFNGNVLISMGQKTDAAGKFKMERQPWMSNLTAYSSKRDQAGTLKLEKDNEIKIVIGPVGTIKISLEKDGKPYPSGTLMLAKDDQSFGQAFNGSSFTMPVPPGTYKFDFFSMTDELNKIEPVTIAAGETKDLGEQKVQLNTLGRMIGNNPPNLSIAEARGVKPTVQLKDFKGKWVLLEFWGFW
jgi:hypothetical protein